MNIGIKLAMIISVFNIIAFGLSASIPLILALGNHITVSRKFCAFL